MMTLKSLALNCLVVAVAVSCSGAAISPTPTPDSQTATPPAATATSKPVVTPVSTSTPPVDTPLPTVSDARLAGLVYIQEEEGACGCGGGSPWLVTADGERVRLAPSTSMRISPNRQQVAYLDREGLWVKDLGTNQISLLVSRSQTQTFHAELEWSPDSHSVYYISQDDLWSVNVMTEIKQNLTNTPDRHEFRVKVWPSHPELIAFSSMPKPLPEEQEGFPYATLMHTDGTGYTVLAQSPSTDISPSPDNRFILYAEDELNWLYSLGAGKVALPLRDYPLAGGPVQWVGELTWSPSGQALAYWAGFSTEYDTRSTLAVINLQTRKAMTLGELRPARGDQYFSELHWDPTGQRIATWARDLSNQRAGIWIVSADGSTMNLGVLLGGDKGYDPWGWTWSPDGQWIAFTPDAPESQAGIWLIDPQTNQLIQTSLPPEAHVLDWIDLEAFRVGNTYRLTEAGANLNVHDAPVLTSPALTHLLPGEKFTIIKGPAAADGYNWWKVRVQSDQTVGWLVEVPSWYQREPD